MRIVLTGIGIVSALGEGRLQTEQALLSGQSGISTPSVLPTAHKHIPVGEVKLTNQQLKDRCGITDDETISRTSLLGILAAREALTNAGCTQTQSIAFVNGTTVGGMDQTERYWSDRQRHARQIIDVHTAGATTEAIATHLGGFAYSTTISTACSSALNSIILAANLLRTGQYTQVLAGGAESLSLFHFNGFRSLQILSDEQCRPFSANRNGLNLGEGAAFVVVETEESAKARGAEILAYIGGYGNACDAFHQTASSDDGEGAYRAMKMALDMANIEPSAVDYINAHGTATPNNDISESQAMLRLFGQSMPPVSSTKAFTGHTTSAAGSIETVICLIAMRKGFVPMNLGWQEPMENGIVPALQTEQKTLNYVLCNSFGFGGNDSSLLLSSQPHDLPSYSQDIDIQTVTDVSVGEAEDYKAYIPPMVARRLTPAMRSLLVAAKRAMAEADIPMPDAIITATDLGCIHYSVQLLQQLTQQGEDALSPTLFMQSTHNTASSLVAIHTHNHGYNITYSHAEQSLSAALMDAKIQLQSGKVQNVLVLHFEEADSEWQELMSATQKQVPTAARAIILKTHNTQR